jgi:hypothetical protein
MLSTTDDNNESKNSLASGRILNFLNKSLHEALLLVPAIILMFSFGCKIQYTSSHSCHVGLADDRELKSIKVGGLH